jgi:urease accessory protein
MAQLAAIATHTNINMINANADFSLSLTRLLQLCSANLPVGGFSFSQGLEYAVEKSWINDMNTTRDWIELNLTHSISRTDVVIIGRIYDGLAVSDFEQLTYWNQHAIACRESSELLLADKAMGKALVRLMTQLDSLNTSPYHAFFATNNISFITAFAICAYLFEIPKHAAQSGYCWTYIDNQVAAATKLVPLGQTQAQNLLFELSEKVTSAVIIANQLVDDEIGASLPRLAMASAWHENQYTRLFRS